MHKNKSQSTSLAKGVTYFAIVLLFLSGCDKEKPSNDAVMPHTEATYMEYKQKLSAAHAARIADSLRTQVMYDSINKQK